MPALMQTPVIPLADKALRRNAKSLPKIIHIPFEQHPTKKSPVSKQKLPKKTENHQKYEIPYC
jgi:hypothetical protein